MRAITNQDRTDTDRLYLVCEPGTPRCFANPTGGPAELDLVTAASGSDLDLGSSGLAHDLAVPPGVRLCLSGCDATTQPVCDAVGGYVDQAVGAPVSLLAGSVPICLVSRVNAFGARGTADLQSGAVDVVVHLTTFAYLGQVCPRCTGTAVGEVGTCDGGANAGAACVVDRLADGAYGVSRTCAPTGDVVGTVDVALPLTTGMSSLSAETCGGAAGDVVRQGTPSVASPAWPDPDYPKSAADTVLAATFCVPASGVADVDASIGLPGPGAATLPVSAEWFR